MIVKTHHILSKPDCIAMLCEKKHGVKNEHPKPEQHTYLYLWSRTKINTVFIHNFNNTTV